MAQLGIRHITNDGKAKKLRREYDGHDVRPGVVSGRGTRSARKFRRRWRRFMRLIIEEFEPPQPKRQKG